jgi:mannosyltransferase OCH1-like enzyme
MIPKKIFQTWYTKELPNEVNISIEKMKSMNKSYQYFIFDDQDMFHYIKSNFDSDVLKAFDSLTIGAAKADFWRYLILYKEVFLRILSLLLILN